MKSSISCIKLYFPSSSILEAISSSSSSSSQSQLMLNSYFKLFNDRCSPSNSFVINKPNILLVILTGAFLIPAIIVSNFSLFLIMLNSVSFGSFSLLLINRIIRDKKASLTFSIRRSYNQCSYDSLLHSSLFCNSGFSFSSNVCSTELISCQLLINTVCYSGEISNYIMQDNSALQVCLHDLKQLQKDPSIAPKMQSKLKYLQASILNQTIDANLLSQLPQFQKLSLMQTSKKEQISLFINLVKCLTNNSNITYFSNLKASIKKEQTFAGWNTCVLTCDTHQLNVFKKKEDQKTMYRFSLEMLWVSKIYREYRKRFVFGVAYEGQKYQIGFDAEEICSKTHGEVLSLIRERRGVREKLKGANQTSKSTISQSSQLEFQKENGVFQYQFNEDDLIECEQKDYLRGIQERVSNLQLFDNSSFQLVKNIQNGRVLENRKQKSYKVCLLLEKINLEGILLKFIEMPHWNSNVETFKIINRIRNNTFLAYLKLKKYNMLTYPRETSLILTYFHTCSCLTERNSLKESEIKHYLLLESINSDQNPSFGAVRMNLHLTIQFSFVEDSPGTTFLILESKINFNSYEYFSYDREMNMQFFNDFSFFSNYCKQHLHSPDKDKGHTFDLNYCACQLKKRRKLSAESEIFSSSIPQKSQIQQQRAFKTASLDSLDVVQTIRKYNSNIKDEMLGNIIRHCHHEKYYLRSSFEQEVKKWKEEELAARSQRDYLLQGGRWKLSGQNLVFQDEQILKSQKGIIKTILKQIGSNLMAGKSIMNMCLPVEIFDEKSMLEVIASTMGFFPHFMTEAVKTTNRVEQMKFVVLAFLFMNSCFPNVQKPFNPILGQTFQGILGGIPIYLQQTFHHPPISSIFIKTDEFQAHGNFDIHVDLGLNSAYSKISSFFTVLIPKTKTQYVIKFMDVEMGGISFGQRVFRLAGKGFAFEKTNQMYCEITTGKDKKKLYEYNTKLKSSDLTGGIFKVTNAFAKKLMSGDSSKAFEGVKYDDVIEKYSQISGKWYGDVMFDNVVYKTLQNGPFPAILERPSILLPSDPIFRLDILHRKWKEWQKSNEQKEVLQTLQRKDRRLRESYKK